MDSDLLARLDEALLHLSDADRSVVLGRVVLGRSFAELASATGSTDEAVRKRVARALGRLRQRLGVSDAKVQTALAGGMVAPLPASLAITPAAAGPIATALAGQVLTAIAVGQWATIAVIIGLAATVLISAGTWTLFRLPIPAAPPKQVILIQPATHAVSPTTATTAPLAVSHGSFVDPPLSPGPAQQLPQFSLPQTPNEVTVTFLQDGDSYFAVGGTLNTDGTGPTRTYTGRFFAGVRTIGDRGVRIAAEGPGFPATAGAVTPDGRRAIFSIHNWNGSGDQLRTADLAGPDAGQSWLLTESTPNGVTAMAITRDGALAATAQWNTGTIDLWDLPDRTLARTLRSNRPAGVLAFDHAGEHLIAGNAIGVSDGPMRIWNLTDDTVKDVPGPSGRTPAIAVAPDDSSFATIDATGGIWVIGLPTPAVQWFRALPLGELAHCVAFSPDGQWLAVASDQADPAATPDKGYLRRVTLRVFDVAGGRVVAKLSNIAPAARTLAFMPDGKQLVTDQSQYTFRWNLPDLAAALTTAPAATTAPASQPAGPTVIAMPSPMHGSAAAMSGDGKTLFVGNGSWDMATQRPRQPWPTQNDVVQIRPDLGRALVTGYHDQTGFAAVVELATGKEIVRVGDAALPYIDAAAISGDGRFVVLACGTRPGRESPAFKPRIGVWDIASGRTLWQTTDDAADVRCLAFSADGTRLFVGGGSNAPDKPAGRRVQTLDTASGKKLAADRVFERPIVSLVVSPDGKQTWAAHAGGPVIGWDNATGQTVADSGQFPTDGPGWDQTPLAISPDGRTLAAGYADTNVYLIDAATGHIVRRLTEPTEPVTTVAFSPDGAWLIAVDRQAARVWNMISLGRR